MKEFSGCAIEAKKLTDMIYAPMCTKTLFAAIELDIFQQLDQWTKYTQIAEKLELHPPNTQCLLDALAAMELVEKDGDCYKNTKLSSKYLIRGGEWFIGDCLMVSFRGAGFDEIDIVRLVREGPEDGVMDKHGLEAFEQYGDYTQMIKNGQRGGNSREIAALASSLPEFNGFKRMLDLGGGAGLIGIAIVEEHPDMTGVIFDTPHVGRAAQESIWECSLEDRVEVMTGDYMSDSIGEGYDFVLAMGTLNFAKHDLDKIIKKIYDSLNPGGVFMCISEGLNNDKTAPREIILSWLPSWLNGYNFSLQHGEISDSAIRNGFRSVYKRTLNLFVGEMDVDIARK